MITKRTMLSIRKHNNSLILSTSTSIFHPTLSSKLYCLLASSFCDLIFHQTQKYECEPFVKLFHLFFFFLSSSLYKYNLHFINWHIFIFIHMIHGTGSYNMIRNKQVRERCITDSQREMNGIFHRRKKSSRQQWKLTKMEIKVYKKLSQNLSATTSISLFTFFIAQICGKVFLCSS